MNSDEPKPDFTFGKIKLYFKGKDAFGGDVYSSNFWDEFVCPTGPKPGQIGSKNK